MEMQFKTKDLSEAAYLYLKGRRLTQLEKDSELTDYYFVFEGKDCESLANQYWAKEGFVIAKDYADSLRTLKDRLFARKGSR